MNTHPYFNTSSMTGSFELQLASGYYQFQIILPINVILSDLTLIIYQVRSNLMKSQINLPTSGIPVHIPFHTNVIFLIYHNNSEQITEVVTIKSVQITSMTKEHYYQNQKHLILDSTNLNQIILQTISFHQHIQNVIYALISIIDIVQLRLISATDLLEKYQLHCRRLQTEFDCIMLMFTNDKYVRTPLFSQVYMSLNNVQLLQLVSTCLAHPINVYSFAHRITLCKIFTLTLKFLITIDSVIHATLQQV